MQDIAAHLQGGIPSADIENLERYWRICPGLQKTLFKKMRTGYMALAVDKNVIKTTIYEHPEFSTFIEGMNAHFAAWRKRNAKMLRQLKADCHPKEVIANLSEDLLTHYTGKPLIDNYDVYQHLMDYWAETMQDDSYLIASDGWKAETYRIIEKDKKGKEKDKGWTCDLIPKSFIVTRFFTKEKEVIDKLSAELESVTSGMTELEEEHGGEDGLFSELDKVNKANVAARVKEIKNDKDANDEITVLNKWLELSNKEAELKGKLKDAEIDLDSKAYAQYPKLSEDDIKSLVVDDKWLSALEAAIHGEMDRISQALTQRVKELAERYETPMPKISETLKLLEKKVEAHLKKMGFAYE